MAYFIFLKYLDSLEDFRKNPHVKIPPKSPPTNFQSLGLFKNQIVIQKRIFPHFRPNRPSGQPAHLAFRPSHGPFFSFQPVVRPLSPLGLSLSAGPVRPLGPADRALVASRLIAASLTVKCLTSRHLRPSPCLADRWHHLSSPSSDAARAPLSAAASSSRRCCRALPRAPSLYGRPLPLLNLSYNHNYSL
jgi:hypothetical protein